MFSAASLFAWGVLKGGGSVIELKVKSTLWKFGHIRRYFQSAACCRDARDTARANLHHISHHVVITHLITFPIKLAQHCQTVWIQFFSLFPFFPLMSVYFLPLLSPSLPRFSYLCCLYRAALIKHGVGGGTESSSRAEEKGSNSSSQDGTLTYNGPAVLSAPHRVPTESPLLRQLFNRPPLTTHFQLHTYKHTCIGTHKLTCTSATHKHTHTPTRKPPAPCVCVSLVLQLTLLWAFWSAPKAKRQSFYFSHHAGAQELS